MARTYTDIPEPRKVLEADTIRGYTRSEVEEALAGGDMAKNNEVKISYPDDIDIELTEAQALTLLGGGEVIIDGAYTDFFPELPKYKQLFTIKISSANVIVTHLTGIGPNNSYTEYSATGYWLQLSAVKTLQIKMGISGGEVVGITLRVY